MKKKTLDDVIRMAQALSEIRKAKWKGFEIRRDAKIVFQLKEV